MPWVESLFVYGHKEISYIELLCIIASKVTNKIYPEKLKVVEFLIAKKIKIFWSFQHKLTLSRKNLLSFPLASLVAQRVKRLPATWETRVQSLGWEDLLEKEMATHSSILAWRIPWTEEPGGLQFTGSQTVRHDWATSLSFPSHSVCFPRKGCWRIFVLVRHGLSWQGCS